MNFSMIWLIWHNSLFRLHVRMLVFLGALLKKNEYCRRIRKSMRLPYLINRNEMSINKFAFYYRLNQVPSDYYMGQACGTRQNTPIQWRHCDAASNLRHKPFSLSPNFLSRVISVRLSRVCRTLCVRRKICCIDHRLWTSSYTPENIFAKKII